MIIKILMLPIYIIEIIVGILGYIGIYGLMITLLLFVVFGLLLPFFILEDKEKVDPNEKIIENPINAVKYTVKGTILLAAIFALLNTIIPILAIFKH